MLQKVGVSMISSQPAHEGAKVVSRTHRPSLPSQYIFPALISDMAPKRLVFLQGKPRCSTLSIVVTYQKALIFKLTACAGK